MFIDSGHSKIVLILQSFFFCLCKFFWVKGMINPLTLSRVVSGSKFNLVDTLLEKLSFEIYLN